MIFFVILILIFDRNQRIRCLGRFPCWAKNVSWKKENEPEKKRRRERWTGIISRNEYITKPTALIINQQFILANWAITTRFRGFNRGWCPAVCRRLVVVPLQDSYRRLLSLRAGSRVLGFALQPFFRAQPPIKPMASAYGKSYFNLLQVSHYHHLSLAFVFR